jgi:hypothetical protein
MSLYSAAMCPLIKMGRVLRCSVTDQVGRGYAFSEYKIASRHTTRYLAPRHVVLIHQHQNALIGLVIPASVSDFFAVAHEECIGRSCGGDRQRARVWPACQTTAFPPSFYRRCHPFGESVAASLLLMLLLLLRIQGSQTTAF